MEIRREVGKGDKQFKVTGKFTPTSLAHALLEQDQRGRHDMQMGPFIEHGVN